MNILTFIAIFVPITIALPALIENQIDLKLLKTARESQYYFNGENLQNPSDPDLTNRLKRQTLIEDEEQLFPEDFEEPGYKVVDPVVIYVPRINTISKPATDDKASNGSGVLAFLGILVVLCVCCCGWLRVKKFIKERKNNRTGENATNREAINQNITNTTTPEASLQPNRSLETKIKLEESNRKSKTGPYSTFGGLSNKDLRLGIRNQKTSINLDDSNKSQRKKSFDRDAFDLSRREFWHE